jgi:hypothetical protein
VAHEHGAQAFVDVDQRGDFAGDVVESAAFRFD